MRPRTTLAVCFALAALLATFPVAQAGAGSAFTFYGSGFGHGIGMSQWGAYGLALQGWNHEQILTHYYSGTTVGRDLSEPRSIRVGLAQGRSAMHVKARHGKLEVRVGDRKGQLVGTISGGETWSFTGVSGRFRIEDGQGAQVGGQLWGGAHDDLVVFPRRGSRALVPETGHSYARGRLELNQYACWGGSCDLRLIAVVPTEEYVYGISEVSSSWPMEALKAQAIAARTYALHRVQVEGQHRGGCNCAVYATTSDQVYTGWDKEHAYDGSRWVKAADRTSGDVIEYGGEPIEALYMASSGGYTENNENVWGGAPLPYLRGVCDPGDFVPENPTRVWRVELSADSVTGKLAPYTGNVGTVTGFGTTRRGVSGRIKTIVVLGTSGEHTITGTQLKAGLGLYDDKVWVDADRNVTGEIRAFYDAHDCSPGLPKSEQVAVPGGVSQRFQNGTIECDGSGVCSLS